MIFVTTDTFKETNNVSICYSFTPWTFFKTFKLRYVFYMFSILCLKKIIAWSLESAVKVWKNPVLKFLGCKHWIHWICAKDIFRWWVMTKNTSWYVTSSASIKPIRYFAMLQKLIMNVNLSVKGLKINLSTFQPYKSGLFTLIVC